MKPKCKLVGENGNVFNLIAIVRKTLGEEASTEELKRFDADFANLQQNGGTYDDVLILFHDFVEIN